MKINEKKFPILGCIENNKISGRIFRLLETSGYDLLTIDKVRQEFDFFKNKKIQINYIASTIHDKLSDTSNFIKAKSLLLNSPETTGLLLLPETILPDFTHVPEYVDAVPKDYPINAILYSWLSSNEHDKIYNKRELENLNKKINAGIKPPPGANWDAYREQLEDDVEYWDEESRTLIIIPLHDSRITQASDEINVISNDELYGTEYDSDGREWYGKVHDYVMSFLLFYHYTETETHIVHGADTGQTKRIKLNDEKFLNETSNNIEIIDVTYFTKLIRTGEFDVSGHFRVQHFGPGNSEAKIVFIESYKKDGYTRGAKIDRRN